MQYGQVLARSLSIAWRHKYLWLLAIFAVRARPASVRPVRAHPASAGMLQPRRPLQTGIRCPPG